MIKKQSPKEPIEREDQKPSYMKSFLLNFGAGAVFGLIAALIFLQLGASPLPTLAFIVCLPLFTGCISGIAGLGAEGLDTLLQHWGMSKPIHRHVVSFGAVAISTFTLVYLAARYLGITKFPDLQRYGLWGGGTGLFFGGFWAILTYRSELLKKKMAMLEIENRHLAELASREDLLQEAARNLAVAEERNRMARELHDSISQGVHGIVYSLRTLRILLKDDERGMEILGHLDETADGTLKELRRLIQELNPSPLEDHGLIDALNLHCDLFARRQKTKMDVQLKYNGELQPDQEVAIYRITQEALTNIYKHAEASFVQVSLLSCKGTVLTITDNGKGFEAAKVKKGNGLANIANRTRQSGGHLQILTNSGQGTTITVEYPNNSNS